MAVNQDYATPLLVSQPLDYENEETMPTKHSWVSWVAFVLAILAVIGTFGYALSYTFLNTYTTPVPPPIVLTLTGNVSGYWDPATPNLAVFRGIPYADQPIGSKRWKLPGYPAPKWSGTLQATSDGKMCYQFGARSVEYFPNQAEDCLNLNVWTSNLNNATGLWDNITQPAPTLVWIYGGSNVYGSIDMYAGIDNWARNGPICLVSMNYRLNAFGYLALEELSKNDTRGVSGNYGIADIQAALQWVQDNIGAFGCDAKRVTLFGQSSGGTNIFALLSSAKSKGLFHRAISLSGSANITMNLTSAQAQNRDFVDNIGCSNDPDILTCLYNKNPAQILQAIPNDTKTGWAFTDFWPTDPQGLDRPGLVIVDGDIVTMPLRDALAKPLIDVDVIIQNMRDELELFWQAPDVVALNASAYNDYLIGNFKNWTYMVDSLTTGEAIAKQYQSITDVNVTRSYYDLNSDMGIFCANVAIGKIAAQAFTHAVYVSTVFQPPSHPMTVDPTLPPLSDPMHIWDYMASSGAWDFWSTNGVGGSIFFPNSSQDPVPPYTPSTIDNSFSTLLSSQFYEFIITGKITNGMAPINNVTGFPTNYNIAVQGDDSGRPQVQVNNTINFRSEYCELLKKVGIEPNGEIGPIDDGRFWWIN